MENNPNNLTIGEILQCAEEGKRLVIHNGCAKWEREEKGTTTAMAVQM